MFPPSEKIPSAVSQVSPVQQYHQFQCSTVSASLTSFSNFSSSSSRTTLEFQIGSIWCMCYMLRYTVSKKFGVNKIVPKFQGVNWSKCVQGPPQNIYFMYKDPTRNTIPSVLTPQNIITLDKMHTFIIFLMNTSLRATVREK